MPVMKPVTIRGAAAIGLFLARSELVAEWERRVLADDAIPSARRLELFRLRDYVPRFIDLATEVLRGDGYEGALRTKAQDFARVHVVERIDEGFALSEVLGELAHLRGVVLEHLAIAPATYAPICDALEDARAIVERAFTESGTSAIAASTSVAKEPGLGRLGS